MTSTAFDVWSLAECEYEKENGYIKDYDIALDFFEEIVDAALNKGLHPGDHWEEIVNRICGAYDGAPDRGPAPPVGRVL